MAEREPGIALSPTPGPACSGSACDELGKACQPGATAGCSGAFGHCLLDAWGQAYCTATCRDAADCPVGYKHCLPDGTGVRACHRKADVSSAACGKLRLAPGVGSLCRQGSCSHDTFASVCARPAGPAGPSFCTRRCSSDSECGALAFCGALAGLSGQHCVPFECACHAAGADARFAALREGLEKIHRAPCDIGHRIDDLRNVYGDGLANDALRLTIFNRLYYAPLAVPAFMDSVRAGVKQAAGSTRPASALLRLAGELWDEPFAEPPLPAATTSFEEAVLAFHDEHDLARRQALLAAIKEAAGELPSSLKKLVAPLLVAQREAIRLRDEAIGYLRWSATQRQRFFSNTMAMFFRKAPGSFKGAPIDLSQPLDQAVLLRHLDYGKLLHAAALLASAIEASAIRNYSSAASFRFNHATPRGRIVIRDGRNDTYLESDAALEGDLAFLLDTGGDDTYEIAVGATRSPENPVSVLIDLGGKDRYTYRKKPHPADQPPRLTSDQDGRADSSTAPVTLSERHRQGSGNLGVGLLFDLGGADDSYESLRFAQGAGLLGVGVLVDDGGNDSYRAEAGSQAAAHLGVGLLLDGGGDDSYWGYSAVQAATYVHGVALLVDVSGNDTYWSQGGDRYIEASDLLPGDDPLYGSGLTQGSAWGRRADYPLDGLKNGVHSSGGVAALFDLAGSDRYSCGSFCQGSGYWFGLGLLHDESGDDQYDGRIYNLGAAVYFGLGLFSDSAGHDAYLTGTPNIGLSAGFAHDLSIGWHQDQAGNDTYLGAWQSLGTGSNHSLGVFWNASGDDAYASTHYLGWGMCTVLSQYFASSHPRHALRTTGIFVDGQGKDTYSRPPFFDPELLAENTIWVQPNMETIYPDGKKEGRVITVELPNAFSFGVDRQGE